VLTTGGAKLRRATYTYDIMSLGDHAKSRKAKQSEGERARAVIKGYVRDKRSVAPCPSCHGTSSVNKSLESYQLCFYLEMNDCKIVRMMYLFNYPSL
jgi:hypothetical protein